jgi:restriction system protein
MTFESLVADLFRAMGMQAVTTQRSNDGGVDVDATDPTPLRGGKIVVQVKRYRNTVPPTAVRDLSAASSIRNRSSLCLKALRRRC